MAQMIFKRIILVKIVKLPIDFDGNGYYHNQVAVHFISKGIVKRSFASVAQKYLRLNYSIATFKHQVD